MFWQQRKRNSLPLAQVQHFISFEDDQKIGLFQFVDF